MVQIVPAILATTEEGYQRKLQQIENSNQFEWVQIDLMDGEFVQNKSVGVDVLAKQKTELKKEAHLMVEYPENWIDELIKVGIDRVVFPVEDREGVVERIQHLKNHEVEVGLSINPETSVETLDEFMSTIDVVLVMSVHPGSGGQEFMPESLSRIKEIIRLAGARSVKIGVDGGINEENIKNVVEAGADYVVIGSSLLEGNIDANYQAIITSLQI